MSRFLSSFQSKFADETREENISDVDECLKNMIFEAGVDYETRPINFLCMRTSGP